jgi:hypothetical protein
MKTDNHINNKIMKQLTTSLKGVMFLAFALVLSLNCGAQTLNSIQNSFANYSQYALQEKVFVHTDKGAYMTGEIMWFKVYAVDGTYNKPLNLSKVVYVELLDNNQVAVLQTKVELRNGSGSGSVYIPVTTANGSYKLRAYTNWMKNFSPEFYFEKNITLVNPQIAPTTMAALNPGDFDIQFFPEGGDLVNGISSKVAFKAVDKNGKGISFSGAIINQKNDTIVKFKPQMFGMGNFSFTPDAANTYKAVIKVGSGAAVVKNIPAIDQQGYVMQLTDNGSGQLQITVTSNIKVDEPDLYLFAHSKQVVKAVKRVVPSNGVASFTIDKSTLEEGITHITIFNNDKKPVCERLYFKRPSKLLAIDASADKSAYGERKQVNISLATKDNTGKLQDANLSMSVYRLDAFQTLEPGDIASYLWLSSDLKGNIESAEYYLKNNNAEADAAADNLMLTQGWRRFQWSEVLKNKPASFTFLPEYNGHIVTGKLVNTVTNTPTADVVTYFGIPGKKVQVFTARSDSSGKLLFNTKGFYGPGEIVVQTNTQHDSTYRIDIVSPFSEQYSKSTVPNFNITPDMQASLEKNSLGMQVLNIYSGENIRRYGDLPTDSTAFFGIPDKSYKLDDYTRFTTMEEVLREYIREVYVVKSDKRFHIKVISGTGFLEGDPLVLLDGIPIFDIDKVVAIDPLKVRKLDVIKDRYFWGPADAEGILSYTTYKGDLGGVELDPHAVVLDYEGLQLQRVFYSPAYDSDKAVASRVPDFRNVLYWAPTVRTGADGKKQLSFYTSDQEGQYIGVVQGITADGVAGSQYFKFDVKK